MSDIDNKAIVQVNESTTAFKFGGQVFYMHEMSIGRAKEFSLMFGKIFDDIKEQLATEEMKKADLITLMQTGTEPVFEKIKDVFNFLFEYKNKDFKGFTKEFLEENISIRLIKEVVKEVARQNQMDWLLPFFKSELMKSLLGK